MQSDLPHTLYKNKKNKKKGSHTLENYTFNPNDKAIAMQIEANRKRQERLEKERNEAGYTMDELFNKQ